MRPMGRTLKKGCFTSRSMPKSLHCAFQLLEENESEYVLRPHAEVVGCYALVEPTEALSLDGFAEAVNRPRVQLVLASRLVHQPAGDQVERLHADAGTAGGDGRRDEVHARPIGHL
eukprot:5533892-Pleurochrysis_carterae.AAC.6